MDNSPSSFVIQRHACADCGIPDFVTPPKKRGMCEKCMSMLMHELRMPDNAMEDFAQMVAPGSRFGSEWRDYHIHFTGLIYDREAPPHRGAFSIITITPLSPITDEPEKDEAGEFQPWLGEIFYRDHPVYAELRWHPDDGRKQAIRGLECRHRKADIDRAWRSFKPLINAWNRVGKPKGRGTRLPAGDTRWLIERFVEYCAVADLQGWEKIHMIDFVDYLQLYYPGLHVDTLRDYMKREGIPWPPVAVDPE